MKCLQQEKVTCRIGLKSMSLNQMNEDLNDAFIEYYRPLGLFGRRAFNTLTRLLLTGIRLRTRLFGGRLLVNERIVEYPQVLRWINPKGIVLDIGCVSSRLPIELASLGYEVHGIDPRPYPFRHPNFHFHQADLFDWSPERPFDIVIMVSTLDHFGLGIYGDRVLPEADKDAVERISSWLSENGQLLVTVPFGKAGVTKRHRVFDLERLRYLFSAFKWKEQKYFKRVQGSWLPCGAEELQDVASLEMPPNGAALLNLQYVGGKQ